MIAVDASTLAIAEAIRKNTIRVDEGFSSTLQEPYWFLSDDHGMIETFTTREDAMKRWRDVMMQALEEMS